MSNIAQTPEAVAYNLLLNVMASEKVNFAESDRKYILDTYAECLKATKYDRVVKP